MITIHDLLAISKEYGASDLHITVGVPPKCRVNGELRSMDFPKFLPDDTEAIIKPMLNDYHQKTLDEYGDVDFAYSISA